MKTNNKKSGNLQEQYSLSASGRLRQQELLDELNREVTRLPVARRVRAGLIALGLILVAAVGLSFLPAFNQPQVVEQLPSASSDERKTRSDDHVVTNPPSPFSIDNVLARNDSSVVDRYVVSSKPISELAINVELLPIDLRDLQSMIGATGSKYAVGRIDGQIILLSTP